jgi:hypothetical protein
MKDGHHISRKNNISRHKSKVLAYVGIYLSEKQQQEQKTIKQSPSRIIAPAFRE